MEAAGCNLCLMGHWYENYNAMVDGHNAWWGTNNSFDNDQSWLDKDNSYNDNTWWWLMKITPGGRTLMKGGTLGNMERRRGERSSNAILTFASFSPALNVTCYFFSFRSRLVICDPLTSIDSLHLNSQVKKNNVVFKATDWHEKPAGQLWLNQEC